VESVAWVLSLHPFTHFTHFTHSLVHSLLHSFTTHAFIHCIIAVHHMNALDIVCIHIIAVHYRHALDIVCTLLYCSLSIVCSIQCVRRGTGEETSLNWRSTFTSHPTTLLYSDGTAVQQVDWRVIALHIKCCVANSHSDTTAEHSKVTVEQQRTNSLPPALCISFIRVCGIHESQHRGV
jgi:hypothetical protein